MVGPELNYVQCPESYVMDFHRNEKSQNKIMAKSGGGNFFPENCLKVNFIELIKLNMGSKLSF